MTQPALLKVLLVEDSLLVANRLSELINDTPGTEVSSVVTTEAHAVGAILEGNADIVILDLRLKEGTGFGVLRSLKSARQLPVTIVMTNYALPQYRSEAINLGASYFLNKADDFDDLPFILAKLVATEKMILMDKNPN